MMLEGADYFLPESIVDELPFRLGQLAHRDFGAEFDSPAAYLARHDADPDELSEYCQRFQREVGGTFGRGILPEPAAGEVRLNDRRECLLKYRDRRARLQLLRWGGVIQLRERLPLTPRSRVGAVMAFLEEVLAFPLVDGGQAVPPKREQSFGEKGGAFVELAAPRTGFAQRYSRIQAYFDGQLLLVHLIPLIVRPTEEDPRRYPHPDEVVRQLRTARPSRL